MDTKNILKELRTRNNFSLKEVAEKSGVSYSAYQKYESGEREIGAKSLEKLANFYGVTTDYLLGREPQTDPFANLSFNTVINDKKFIEIYSGLPDYAKQIFIETMSKLVGAIEENEKGRKKKSADSEEKPLEYEEYTAGELHDMLESSDEDNTG